MDKNTRQVTHAHECILAKDSGAEPGPGLRHFTCEDGCAMVPVPWSMTFQSMEEERKTPSNGIGSDRDEMGNPFLPLNEDTELLIYTLFGWG